MEKVIDIEERIPSMRKKRRKKTNRKFVFILLLFVTILLVLLYFQSQASKIDAVVLEGSVLHDKDFYLKQAGISSGDSIWGFDIENATKRLRAVEGVQEASVSRKWFRDVHITVQEWSPIAWMDRKGQYELILENGDVFTPDEEPLVDIPIVDGFEDEEVRKLLASQLIELDDSIYQLVSEIVEQEDSEGDQVILYMDDGYEVHASLGTLSDKLSYYPEIVNQLNGSEKGVIDVEVGTYFTPYSKLYGSEESKVDKENAEEEKGDDSESKDE
ncbi:cell division protein FtsQ/DivIB [Sporosarcina aquimarina]|uniref:cell division protein FtsQ/DivIB n=1 Tax=Sporosarcina aquimarina TaxID=114975 RepID=UPI0020417624|nr:cell division protein FtsQ/DivIB [Sporosarcina aquimarina]MCM3756635.1 cell division protein FtsQ/DivIB [Sporosarcina aquimarina]